jgi:Protein of unknown function (DUF3767)
MPSIPDKDETDAIWTDDRMPSTRISSTEHADATVSTFDTSDSSSYSPMNATSSNPSISNADTPNTARWTRYLPEAYGIRQSVENSKYRWCARESAMWGIATGTAMALHRMRMNSPMSRVINVGFASVFVVMGGSYYFCVKRRDYQEEMIELLMRLNTFEHAQNMPPERPIDATHPFMVPSDAADDNGSHSDATTFVPAKQYVAVIPERKEWQAPVPTQDAADIFQPYQENDNSKK